MATIRIGIGGWSFEPWRGPFFPPGLPHAQELHFASRRLRTLEINGTFYRLQTPATFAGWRAAVPEGFVFSVKAHRAATNRRDLREAGESVARFLASGVAELGDALGPILWQLAPTKRFDADEMRAFLQGLPATQDGVPLRHAVEPRHPSFACAEWLALARAHGVASVFDDGGGYPAIPDATAGFVYARVMRTEPQWPLGVPDAALDALVACTRAWRDGDAPVGLPYVEPPAVAVEPPAAAVEPSAAAPARDVFLFFISAAKERAPLAATALTERLAAAGL